VVVLRHAVNLGVGAAVQSGFRYALQRGYAIGVQLDADRQHDPRDLEALVAPVREGRCDVAIGSRYVTPTGYRTPRMRRLGMLWFAAVVHLALGQRIADTTSGSAPMDGRPWKRGSRTFPETSPTRRC
jgi:glycosyltransferase involved in cell wall biosynthesis